MHLSIQREIQLCDQQVELTLQTFTAAQTEGIIEQASPEINKKPKTSNQPAFNTREYLKNIHGVDVLDIHGISEIGALEILSETGTHLVKWPTEKHFASWLNLCPNNKISGGKLISSQMLKKKPNPASQAFRTAANTLQRSNHWLGDYFRRMKAKSGNKYAIVPTSRKLAIIYYKMVRHKQPFQPFDNDEYKQKCQRAKIAYLERALARLKEGAA